MAAGTTIYRQANVGNLGKFIGDKIGSARKMAAEARKKNKDSDVETGRGYYFGKALASEFGGDRIARTKGMFKTNPDVTQDPALSKKQRFEGGIAGELKSVQDVIDEGGTQDKPLRSWLTPLLDAIASNNRKIADAFRNMGKKTDEASDEQEEQNQTKKQTVKFFDFLGSWIDNDNELWEEENKLHQEKLDRMREAQDDASMAGIESMQEAPGVSSADGGEGEGEGEESATAGKKKGSRSGGLLSNITEGLTEGIAEGFTEKLVDRIGKSNKFGRILRRTPFGKRRMRNAYKKKIGPLEMGSKAPWAKAGPGERGNAFGFVPRLAEGTAPMTKLAPGTAPTLQPGRYNKPTVGSLGMDDAVVPLGKNNPISDLMDQAEGAKNKMKGGSSEISVDKEAKLLQDVTLSLPQVAAGMTLGSIGNLVPGLSIVPGVSNYLIDFARDKAKEFGLPENLIGNVTRAEVIKQKKTSGGIAASAGSSITTINDKKSKKKEDNTPGWVKAIKNIFGLGNTRNNPTNPRRRPLTGIATKMGRSMLMTGGQRKPGSYITSAYRSSRRPNHMGIDVAGGPFIAKAPVAVKKPGKVHEIGNQPNGWGNYVVVEHDDGKYTLYGHLDEVNVKQGQRVGPDSDGNLSVIGKIGNTGRSTDYHLHFELGTGWNGTIQGNMDPTSVVNDYVTTGGQVSPGEVSPDAEPFNISAAQDFLDGIAQGLPPEEQQIVQQASERPIATIVPLGYNSSDPRTRAAAKRRQMQANIEAQRLADAKLEDEKNKENYPTGARA